MSDAIAYSVLESVATGSDNRVVKARFPGEETDD